MRKTGRMMEPNLDIPKTHSPRRALKLIVMIAIASLCFYLASAPLTDIALSLAAD